ncbi:MAG: hypothetical protein VYC15_01925 [Pseudomonadota bacterium]|nr:hypothetical protein [Pseudomonadota bacterium]|tara:strand:- start:732 stop:1025 length:294 start_codon:yes stop_codon:yes gene_type:complete
MTKDALKNIGLIINLFIVFLFAFVDDYLFKTANLEYFKLEYKDSFLWNITHKILDGFLPEMITAGIVGAITAYLLYLSWSCRGCTGNFIAKITGGGE